MKSIFAWVLFLSAVSAHAGPSSSVCYNVDHNTSSSNTRVYIDQRLPVGDTMTATFTSNGETIYGVDENGAPAPVYCTATVGVGTTGIFFGLWGVINGHTVTDGYQTHTHDGLNGTLQFAAFTPASDGGGAAPLESWLEESGYVGTAAFTIPDFITTMDLFYGVDLSVWSVSGFAIDDSLLGSGFNIVNGFSDLLPGFVFSTDPLIYTPFGWETSSAFSGAVTLDSYHSMSILIPEPNTFALFGLSIGLLMMFMKKRKL